LPYKRIRSHSSEDSGTISGVSAKVAGYRPSDRLARRFLYFLVGVWFGLILSVGLGLPRGMSSVDQVMLAPAPEATEIIKEIGAVNARMLLRYQISEAHRHILGGWGWAQLGLGVLVFGVVLFGTSSGRLAIGLSAGMLALASLMSVFVIPRMEAISRTLDFSPATGGAAADDLFELLHRGCVAFEAVIVILGVLLFGVLSKRRRNRSEGGRDDGFGSASITADRLD